MGVEGPICQRPGKWISHEMVAWTRSGYGGENQQLSEINPPLFGHVTLEAENLCRDRQDGKYGNIRSEKQ